jgi:hypothetical protein
MGIKILKNLLNSSNLFLSWFSSSVNNGVGEVCEWGVVVVVESIYKLLYTLLTLHTHLCFSHLRNKSEAESDLI